MVDNLNFNCEQYYINLTNFKEKDTQIIRSILLNGSFTSHLLSFNSYGIVSFSDNKHKLWSIKLIDSFNKKSTNAMIFDVKEDELNNPYHFDKLVLYQNSMKNLESFGYIWIRTEDDHTSIHSYLEYEKDNILKQINKDITTWHKHYIFDIYCRPEKATKKEFEELYKKYIEEYRWSGSYEDWQNSFKSNNQQYQTYSTY